jgi:hypothetical protein
VSAATIIALQLPGRFLILLQVLYALSMVVDVAFLQKPIKCEPGKPRQLACLIMRERSGAIKCHSVGEERALPPGVSALVRERIVSPEENQQQ